MRSESIKLKWLLGSSLSELRSQSLKHGPASLYFDNIKQAILNKDLNSLEQFLEHEEYRSVVNFKGPDGYALIHIAALQTYSGAIDFLVNAGCRPNLHDCKGRSSLHLVVSKIGCRCPKCSNKRMECIETLIGRGANPDAEDMENMTPLYYAAKNRLSNCATLLLEKGCDLHHWNEKTTVLKLLLEYIPTVMSKELDKCITSDYNDNSKLRVDFSLLMQVRAIQGGFRKQKESVERVKTQSDPFEERIPRETELLGAVLTARTGQDVLLTHPVIETFLHFKWLTVRKFFFVFRSIYFLLTLLYTCLMFKLYSFEKYKDKELFNNSSSVQSDPENEFIYDIVIKSMSGFLMACGGIMIISEIYKMCQDSKNYFTSYSGYLWWILSIIWGVTLSPAFMTNTSLKNWQFPIASLGMIFTWTMNLVQLGRIPWFAVHVALLVNVVKDFLLLLSTFAMVLIAFTLGFCILIPNNNNFDSFLPAIFKILLMMKGDIDYEGVLDKRTNPLLVYPEYYIPAHLLYAAFVIIVTMLLTALLIGLAVKDIGEMEKKAGVNRSIRIIKEIGIFESLIRNRFLTCGMADFLVNIFSIEKLSQIQNYSITFSPTNLDDFTLPNELKEKFIPYLDSLACQKHPYLKKGYIPIPTPTNNN